MIDSVLLSPTKPKYARYEGTDDEGRDAYVIFEETGAFGQWEQRWGIVGFAPSGKLTNILPADTQRRILAVISNGYRLVDEESAPKTENPQEAKSVMSFHDWLRQ